MNYRWIKSQIKNQIQTFFYHKQKNGFSLYNPFIDLYINPKTKVILCLIDSIILSIFYSSLTDFYYLGPYLLNLISSIKFLCNSKELKYKIIYDNFLDINTMICDLIGFFNGFTRALCQDYNCYLGCDAIYNERCFLHLRKNNNDSILVMCREHSGSNDYFQEKSIQQLKPKLKDKNINEKENENKIEVKNRNILMFIKFKKNEKKMEYLTYDYNSYSKKKYDYDDEHKINNKNNLLDKSIITNNLDFPSESQLFDDNEDLNINDNMINNGNKNEKEQNIEVFDFINNMINQNDEINYDYNNINNDKKKNQLSKSYNFAKENNYEKFKPQKSIEIKNNYSLINNNSNNQPDKNIHNFFRNKTMNYDKRITLKNMELIKNIDFGDLVNDDTDEHSNEINNGQKINYENINKNSIFNNFYQINNNYIDDEINQVFNNDNFNTINNNNNNFNKNNNIYYPSQETNMNLNNNVQSIVPYIPQFNFSNANNNMINAYNYTNQKSFSQNDLSFLNGYSKINNLKEDFIKIDKKNPTIISELKEKINYYYFLSKDNNKLINISLKGYIGINIKPPNIINNKEFYINFFNEKWKDYNHFTNRELNKNIEQITENIYKICLIKQQNAIKLITYSINKNIIEKINLIRTQIKIFNNILMYKFDYMNKIVESVKNIEIIIEYKNDCPKFNKISTDGIIVEDNNYKSNIIYKKVINEGKILFPFNNIYLYINKINIQIILKNTLLTDMNCKISFSNSVNQCQESLPCKKISLISFQYEC